MPANREKRLHLLSGALAAAEDAAICMDSFQVESGSCRTPCAASYRHSQCQPALGTSPPTHTYLFQKAGHLHCAAWMASCFTITALNYCWHDGNAAGLLQECTPWCVLLQIANGCIDSIPVLSCGSMRASSKLWQEAREYTGARAATASVLLCRHPRLQRQPFLCATPRRHACSQQPPADQPRA